MHADATLEELIRAAYKTSEDDTQQPSSTADALDLPFFIRAREEPDQATPEPLVSATESGPFADPSSDEIPQVAAAEPIIETGAATAALADEVMEVTSLPGALGSVYEMPDSAAADTNEVVTAGEAASDMGAEEAATAEEAVVDDADGSVTALAGTWPELMHAEMTGVLETLTAVGVSDPGTTMTEEESIRKSVLARIEQADANVAIVVEEVLQESISMALQAS